MKKYLSILILLFVPGCISDELKYACAKKCEEEGFKASHAYGLIDFAAKCACSNTETKYFLIREKEDETK